MGSRVIEPVQGQLVKTLSVRLPVDIYMQLANLARQERRTLHTT